VTSILIILGSWQKFDPNKGWRGIEETFLYHVSGIRMYSSVFAEKTFIFKQKTKKILQALFGNHFG
jgi:hypothetical protein